MRVAIAGTLAAAAAVTVGCGQTVTSPSFAEPPAGTHQAVLTASIGRGLGGVSVSPVSNATQTFEATIRVQVARAARDTTYIVQRAPEVGRANAADGVCQRALGQSPWSPSDPPAPAFVTFAPAGPPITVTTDASGNGSVEFRFAVAVIPAGTAFDVMFRLADDVAAPTAELRSTCFTVTAR
jgi:hypothetical protein